MYKSMACLWCARTSRSSHPHGPWSFYSKTLHHASSCCTALWFPANAVNHALQMPEAGEQFLQLVSIKSNIALTMAVWRLQSYVTSQVLDWKEIRSLLNRELRYQWHGLIRASLTVNVRPMSNTFTVFSYVSLHSELLWSLCWLVPLTLFVHGGWKLAVHLSAYPTS